MLAFVPYKLLRIWSKADPYYNPVFISKKIMELLIYSLKGYVSQPFTSHKQVKMMTFLF